MGACPRYGGKGFWSFSSGQKRFQSCGLTRKPGKIYWQKTGIPPYWKGRLTEFFCLGVPACRLRFQVPLNTKIVQRWFKVLRETIYQQALRELKPLSGEIEMDETMFGGKRSWQKG